MATQAIGTTDVIVIGGGPSGTTAATLLAKKGHRVTLYERDKFPRFHIGESLIPETYWTLRELGMLEKMKGSHFIKKYSVQFVNERGKLSEPFFFWDHKPQDASQTWQVLRSEFDQTMLDNARANGVEVHEEARVLEVLFEGDRAVGVSVALADGTVREERCQVVVDASGQSSMIMSKLGLRTWDPFLKKAAVWSYFKGARREVGKNEGATIVMQTVGKKGWFWYIPLHDGITSVGVVSDHEHLFNDYGTKDFEKIFEHEVEICPGAKERLAGATRCDIFRCLKEYSYRTTKGAGDGWVLVGDAFGFLDPLYSSGVLLALASGHRAADAISAAIDAGDTSEAALGSWVPDFVRGMDRMRRLVCEFYDGFSFGKFVRRYPERKGLVTDVLIGDLFKDEIDELWPLIDGMRAEAAFEPSTAPA